MRQLYFCLCALAATSVVPIVGLAQDPPLNPTPGCQVCQYNPYTGGVDCAATGTDQGAYDCVASGNTCTWSRVCPDGYPLSSTLSSSNGYAAYHLSPDGSLYPVRLAARSGHRLSRTARSCRGYVIGRNYSLAAREALRAQSKQFEI